MDFEIVRIPWFIKLANYCHEHVIVPVRAPVGTAYYERTCIFINLVLFRAIIHYFVF